MRPYWLRSAVIVAVLVFAGCSRWTVTPPEGPPEDPNGLPTSIELKVGEWLTLDRAKLAEMAKDWADTVAKQRDKAVTERDSLFLLDKLYPPSDVPVLHAAAYSPEMGISLPLAPTGKAGVAEPYVKPGATDATLALHLARHGDHEAALKWADPKDTEFRTLLDKVRPEKNYPVEWTRLVGLVLQSATWKVASGDIEGAAILVEVHKQLRQILDPKAAEGPLGAALLPLGKRALIKSAEAWRDPKQNKTALAGDIEAAVKEWGEFPPATPLLVPGTDKATVANLLRGSEQGYTVTTFEPAAVARALDVLGQPIPGEGVQGIVAFLDLEGYLAELQFVYQGKIELVYPEPINLGYPLLERGFVSQEPTSNPGILAQTIQGGDVKCEAIRLTRTAGLGALLKVSSVKKGLPKYPLPPSTRDFGPASLDRTFEADRLSLAPEQAGVQLKVTNKAILADLVRRLGLPAPGVALLQREASDDLPAFLTLTWADTFNSEASSKLLPRLWSAFGDGKLEGFDEVGEGSANFTWEDKKTRVRLRVPFAEKSPELVSEDIQGPTALAGRLEAATQRDLADRKARMESGNSKARLARTFSALNEMFFEQIALGQPKARIEETLPGLGSTFTIKEFPGGISLLFTKDPPPGVRFWARQMFIRFGPDGRVAELRVRYQDGLARDSRAPSLLQSLEAAPAGRGESVPPDWEGLWADQKGSSKTVKYRWQDDSTIVTYEGDVGGVEVIRRDRPIDQPAGVALPPLVWYTPGVGKCFLGMNRSDLLAAYGTKLVQQSGADVFRMPISSPYDICMAWSENGKVTRILATHRAKPGLEPTEVAAALTQAWGQQRNQLGYVRRAEGRRGQILGSYFWHDDVARIQIFVQDAQGGPQMFTEWVNWPIGAKDKKVATVN